MDQAPEGADVADGLITNSYPETMNPYRIIPLITESYP